MSSPEIHRHRQVLDNTFKSVGSLGHESELQGHFARYLCVLASGYLETSIQTLLGEYAQNHAPDTAIFVRGRLRSFQNAKMNKIVELLNEFDPTWSTEVATMDDSVKSSVDSLVNLRHQIAHGTYTANVSYVNVRAYYDDVKKLVTKLEGLCA